MATPKRRTAGPRLEALEDRSVPAVIGGIVYNDVNINGLFDPAESGIAGSTLQLRDEAGGLVATATSGADGQYQFTQRNAGNTGPATTSFDAAFSDAPTDSSRTGSLSRFDPALGTLTSIDLIATGSITSDTRMENLGAAQATVQAEYHGQFSYQVQGVTAPITGTTSRTINGTLGAFDGLADLQGSSARDFGPTTMEGQFTAVTITDPSRMAAFVGQGSLQVAQQASATACSCGPGNLMSMVNSTARGNVKVVYHYTPSNEIGPGKYTIVQTPQPRGFADGLDTPDNLTPIPGSDRTDTIQVTVASRTDQSQSNNFGETKVVAPPTLVTPPRIAVPPGSFGKYLFFDFLV